MLGPAGINPFLLIGSLLRLRSVDPEFICPRCRGLESVDSPVTFCPQCKAQRAEAVLLSCPDCNHDFSAELTQAIDWKDPAALPAQPEDPTARTTFKVAEYCVSLAASRDGRWLAASGVGDGLQIFEMAASEAAALEIRSEGGFGELSFSDDGRRLAVLAGEEPDFEVRVFDVSGESGVPVLLRVIPTADAWCVALSPDGRWVVAGRMLMDVDEERTTLDAGTPLCSTPSTQAPSTAAFSPDSRLVAVGSEHSSAVFAVDSGETIVELPGGEWVTFCGSGGATRVAVAGISTSFEQDFRLYDISSGVETFREVGEAPSVGMAVSADGSRVAVLDASSVVTVRDGKSGQECHRFGQWDDDPHTTCVAFTAGITRSSHSA